MFRYPREVVSDVYLSKIGGFSYELDRNEIGVNAKALEQNTSIIANETYARLRMFGEVKPYFFRKKFLVVGVEENMDCYEMTKDGEVVLPEEFSEKYVTKKGEDVLINTVEFFRIDGDYSNVIKAFLCRLESRARRN
jgi:hypothetical protein